MTWLLEVCLVLDCSFEQFFVQQASIFGTNKSCFHPHSSKPRNYWTPRNNLELKIQLLTFFLRKIRIPLRRPDVHGKSNPSHAFYRIIGRNQDQKCSWLLFRFLPNLEYLYQDHSKVNHIEDLNYYLSVPESGTSVGFYIFFICSIDWRSGERPPCIHKILSSIRAATGRQLKQSMKVFQSLILYRLLPDLIFQLH